MEEPAGTVRVLIADDSAVTLFGVRAALERAGFEVCAEAADCRSAVERAIEERPDVCVLDVMMPRGGGIRAAREISQHLPGTAILMLSSSGAGEDVLSALREGAWGYILKDAQLHALADAVRSAADGERPFSKRAVRELMNEEVVHVRRAGAAEGRGAALSDGEWEVLDLLARRLSTKSVALRLGVGEAEVRAQAAKAVRKLEVDDREAALELVRRMRSHH